MIELQGDTAAHRIDLSTGNFSTYCNSPFLILATLTDFSWSMKISTSEKVRNFLGFQSNSTLRTPDASKVRPLEIGIFTKPPSYIQSKLSDHQQRHARTRGNRTTCITVQSFVSQIRTERGSSSAQVARKEPSGEKQQHEMKCGSETNEG
jgi:hypothetical protein